MKNGSLAVRVFACCALLTVALQARADLFTVAGITFDDDNSARAAAIAEGAIEGTNPNGAFLPPADFPTFNREWTIGRLLGSLFDTAHATFPDSNGIGPEPNVTRAGVALTWAGGLLANGAGDDFVIYESASSPLFLPEAFAVAVRVAGSPLFSPFRYEFADGTDTTHEVLGTAFDLDDFGVAAGTEIDAVLIRNVFNSAAGAGTEDRVDDMSGQGFVVYPGDPGYGSAFTLLDVAGGSEYPTSRLDGDPILLVGLHPVRFAAVPEPGSLSMVACGLAALGGYCWRRRR